MMKDQGLQHWDKKGGNYEQAMTQAFSEIFQNLKLIEEDTRKQREMVKREQRRRGSAPCSMLSATTKTFHRDVKAAALKEKPERKISSPSKSTMHWVLSCFEEEEEVNVPTDLNLGFLNWKTSI